MGYLTEADALVKNATEVINTIYSTNFSQYLQGLGQPILGIWFNYNSSVSSVDIGTFDIDHLIGPESPVRYNKILNCPVYGATRDLIPEMNQGDGGLLDLNIEIEVTLLPNSFKPSPYDYFLYEFGPVEARRTVLFRINNIQLSSIRSNSYYKVNMHMIEIDANEQLEGLSRQVVKTFRVDLDRIGTNENCLIEDVVFEKCKDVLKLIRYLEDQYMNLFYSDKYNSVLFRPEAEGQIIYDPYLIQFIIHSKMFESIRGSVTMVVFDQSYGFTRDYNRTFYRAIETRRITDIKEDLYADPEHFTRKTVNPFAYYGEEFAYKITVREDPDNTGVGTKYNDYPFIQSIKDNMDEGLNPIEGSIVRYFNSEDFTRLFNDTDLSWLDNLVMDYSEYYLELMPITIFLLRKYYEGIHDSH